MTDDRWAQWIDDQLIAIRGRGRWRSIEAFDPDDDLVSFAGNDYLGLSRHPAVVEAAHHALDRWGAGAGASRLVVGTRPLHLELEAALADWKQAEAAILFPSGFAANLGVLSTFGRRQATIFSDERNHASIIDGARMAGARVESYRHCDVDQLDTLLAATSGRRLVVTETVFSMDGDLAPLDDIVEVCGRHGALLVLDEAHAVLGPAVHPAGVDVLRVGTLSKALGSVGGFVAGPRRVIDLLVNRARPFIFTTATTPADAAAALAALTVLRGPEGDDLRRALRVHLETISPGAQAPIVPVVIGDEDLALAASAELRSLGLVVPAIRPPTVPVGTSRLRVTLSATHRAADVERLRVGLAAIGWSGT